MVISCDICRYKKFDMLGFSATADEHRVSAQKSALQRYTDTRVV